MLPSNSEAYRPRARAFLGLWLAAVGVVLAASCYWLLAASEQQVVQVVPSGDCRHPLLVSYGDRLFLGWAKGAPVPAGDDRFNHQWRLGWLDVTDLPPPADDASEVSLPTVQASELRSRPAGCADQTGVLLVHPRGIWENQQGYDAVIEHFLPDALAVGETAACDDTPLAVLPHSQEGTQPAIPVSPSARARFWWFPAEEADFTWVDICRDAKGGELWLCAVNTIFASRQLVVTHSSDGAHWSRSIGLARDACYPSICADSGRLIVSFTDAGETSHQSIWSDDLVAPFRPEQPFPAMRGALRCTVSPDGGRTWEAPCTIAESGVISSRCAWAPDGTVWLVYVGWLGDGAGSALQLVSSSDGGATWTAPRQITPGGYVDRDVAIAVHDGRVVVAFSRCDEIGGPSGIWLWHG